MIEVRTSYEYEGDLDLDEDINLVAGRHCDYAGCDFNERELGWYCDSKTEATHIKRALNNIGLKVELSA